MTERTITHEFGGEPLRSVFVGTGGAARGTVIIVPTFAGVSDLEMGFARDLAARGYSCLVADLWGRSYNGPDERDLAFGHMTRLKEDRAALRDRMLDIVEVTRAQEGVDPGRIAAIGYCFGGLCVLDLARSGVDIAGVASFHGLFDAPDLPPQPIRAKVVAYHGWDDPMVPPEAVVGLAKELTDAGADWQIHGYGHVGHAFTNPAAATLGIPGVDYNAAAARRSWAALNDYLDELFG
ncbi:alpha/beta fold hydrolase [Sphingomonas sp. LHG3406-1]|uniref:dienelactone hydrolase family protein n=1 Tax=Sphingomonas sp. LHG3406-1 TaxID=2804617 RepID=UPI002604F4F9|nr:alpha/beta fold hydrolase [Sphingomonas sp. LHG3406-1]